MIKFRGQTFDGKWVYGDLLQDGDTDAVIAESYSSYEDGFIQVFGVAVDPACVGQYTGRKDIHGQKVYAGHTVEVYYMENGVIQQDLVQVSQSEDGHGFSPFNWEYECDGCECGLSIESVEIIDNPDLLKAGGQS
jgi:hypothetical protein